MVEGTLPRVDGAAEAAGARAGAMVGLPTAEGGARLKDTAALNTGNVQDAKHPLLPPAAVPVMQVTPEFLQQAISSAVVAAAAAFQQQSTPPLVVPPPASVPALHLQ